MLKAIFQLLLAYLLCGLIVIASVDRIPDPPVVKPHHDTAAKLCFGGQHHVTPDQNLFVPRISLHLACVVPGSAWNIPCEFTPKLPPETFHYYASDSSPPAAA